MADPRARIVIIGQAPGLQAQESGVPWNHASGRTLINWLGVTEEHPGTGPAVPR
ncbi:uracil-DNA glycosylase family protein [Microlunatus parietis]|uniref:Uracil-DNA glycosylase n=1 Tax=Microlunatus parietis TaxID=682979 RepID=A0A7Y9L9R5_9ACTN|nr:uracil-DNA glycosylase family protein [Microlunatus parietis]NYE69872.1 uracil-DNA glycosylase [Microlunatus parietis]